MEGPALWASFFLAKMSCKSRISKKPRAHFGVLYKGCCPRLGLAFLSSSGSPAEAALAHPYASVFLFCQGMQGKLGSDE
jgi:hypothetical protein